jgi:hypothetical protein
VTGVQTCALPIFAGQIGLEYNFNIPLQLSLDYRPGFYLVPAGHGGAWEGAALGIRYRF